MKRSPFYRLIACAVVVILTVATMNVYAEQPVSKELAHEAFLRGGTAITAAFKETRLAEPLVAASLLPPAPPAKTMPAPPQEGKHRRTLLWVGLAVTGTIAVFLVQLSVRNHNKIFTPTVD